MIYGALRLRLMLLRRSPKVILQHIWQTNYPHISFLLIDKANEKKKHTLYSSSCTSRFDQVAMFNL